MSAIGVDEQTLAIGVLLVRLVTGILMAMHGAQKLFGWFGGYGLNKTGEFFVNLGFWPGRGLAVLASLTEIASGVLVALGFLGPIGPALMISVMIVAMIAVHWKNGLFATNNGVEVPLLYSTVALGLALIGFGRFSVDVRLGLTDRWSPAVTSIVLAIGIVGGLVSATIRHRLKSAAST